MKKLLLATIIASTSFGAAATDSTNPPLEDGLNPILIVNPIDPTVDEKIVIVNQKFTDLGLSAHVTESANGQSFLVYGDGESILLNDLNDEGIADIKERATKSIKDDQIETPITPINPTVDQKIAMVNQKFTDLGLSAHVAELANGQNYLVYGSESILLNDLNDEEIAKIKESATKAIKDDQIVNPINPIDPGFDIDPIIPTVDEKIEFINGHIANIGEGDASIVRDKNGNVQLTFTDQVSGEIRQVNMSELTEEQVAVISTEARKYYDENKSGVNPIIPTVDEKIEFINGHITNIGEGDASIVRDKNGNVQLTFTDQVSGETRQVNMSELTEEQVAVISAEARKYYDENKNGVNPITPTVDEKIAMVNQKFADLGLTAHVTESANGQSVLVYGDGESILLNDLDEKGIADIKDRATKAIKDDQITPISPIDGEKPVPSEGQNIVEGINEKVAELKETYTGEKGKSAKDITTEKLSAIYKTQAQTDSRQDTAISTNAAGIKENKEAITFLNTEIDRLDNKMDGVMAGVHAVNNARPYLTAEGQTAVGAGVGFAGSNSAVAVGLAHAVSASWSVSATMNVTTGDESELSGGFGTQYTF
ncbi:YadA C-terminal domain-containing protein [Photobacterium phosphoreum]|uniref:YadA C-terminal domain-containing protein n=1 Tax=Photobacterium phosphoreum TaxID=659 RepID=UPI0024BB2DBE|nr:YadA C-terminal domain-containing protein [Photobacterium phosphoreum]